MIREDLITSTGPQPRRLRFSVDQYYKMIEMGMIKDYEKSEIIGGEMVKKMTIGDKHAWVVSLLLRFFIKNLPDTIFVRGQDPLRLGDYDEPEPDVVLADLTKFDGRRHPRPEETILVVEVSDSSLKYDRDVKLPLYAEAGIREVWIVNIPNNLIEVHTEPNLDIYLSVKIFAPSDTVVSSVLPELKLEVNEILN